MIRQLTHDAAMPVVRIRNMSDSVDLAAIAQPIDGAVQLIDVHTRAVRVVRITVEDELLIAVRSGVD